MADDLPTDQLIELLVQTKAILQGTGNSPAGVNQVRAIIGTHPQLPYGLMKTMIHLELLDQNALQTTLQASLAQQQQEPPVQSAPPVPNPIAVQVEPPNVPPYPQYPTQSYNYPPQPPAAQSAGYSAPPARNPAPHYPTGPGAQQYNAGNSYPTNENYASLAPTLPGGSLPPAVMALPEDQRAMVMRILAFTPAQIAALPPSERDAYSQIRRQILGPGA